MRRHIASIQSLAIAVLLVAALLAGPGVSRGAGLNPANPEKPAERVRQFTQSVGLEKTCYFIFPLDWDCQDGFHPIGQVVINQRIGMQRNCLPG